MTTKARPPALDAGRATTAAGDGPSGVTHADRLWIALTLARAGGTPDTLAHTEAAVVRFYLPMARRLATASARYREDPEGADQAAEFGLTRAVLGWRHPSGQGFDLAAAAAIIDQLRQAAPEPSPVSPDVTTGLPDGEPVRTTPPRTIRCERRAAVPGRRNDREGFTGPTGAGVHDKYRDRGR